MLLLASKPPVQQWLAAWVMSMINELTTGKRKLEILSKPRIFNVAARPTRPCTPWCHVLPLDLLRCNIDFQLTFTADSTNFRALTKFVATKYVYSPSSITGNNTTASDSPSSTSCRSYEPEVVTLSCRRPWVSRQVRLSWLCKLCAKQGFGLLLLALLCDGICT